MKMPCHQQSWAKVNVPVDSEIVGLIEALSAFPALETIESCQGHDNDLTRVCFMYGDYWVHPWHDLAEFVFGFLAPGLAKDIGDDASLIVRLSENGVALCHLTIRPGAVKRTVNSLKRLQEHKNER